MDQEPFMLFSNPPFDWFCYVEFLLASVNLRMIYTIYDDLWNADIIEVMYLLCKIKVISVYLSAILTYAALQVMLYVRYEDDICPTVGLLWGWAGILCQRSENIISRVNQFVNTY